MSLSCEPAADAVPTIPGFLLVRPIGIGGFGQVWLAFNRTTNQPRAVKLIPKHHLAGSDPAGREIAALMRLEANLRCHHANLLAIHHVGETVEHLFYVMDLADDLSGQADPMRPDYRPATLESRLATGALSAHECLRFSRQLLEALACLHSAGMVHRDVKPANCLFIAGDLKLGDFGLLTVVAPSMSRLGTLRYMPPDGCMDARADVYAAGLVIYEMLTGRTSEQFPCLGDRTREVAKNPQLAALNRLTLRACDPDAARRFRDASEMLAELGACEKPQSRLRHVRRAALLAGVLAGGILAICCSRQAPSVGVNFVTTPYEATIRVDGHLLCTPGGEPYRTPCTIPGLSAGKHHVVFQWESNQSAPGVPAASSLDAGIIDFAENRQVTLRNNAE